jgi:(E)-4-hydroxy-3-methylbut-2-enyl-diphosphate synthase
MLNSDLQVHPGKFCNSLTAYSRYLTREVAIGDVPLGGANPIRIQSMTTTDTMDTSGTVEQSIRMIEAGSDYVRITAPSQNEARNLENIKTDLRQRGYDTPLIADIHFTPNAAEIAARIVEKVRINPGNYADRKKFQIVEYSDAQYAGEIERISGKFTPLVRICKEHGTAMRIGTNHGSLSDRIMSRFGDTPLGMVESALEFVRICRNLDYHQIVLSMKASNTRIMVQAYRLLVNRMEAEGFSYPLHLGVTEAGEGEDGRIKSAVGIGSLLEDGLGDTVRVSLTEEPEAEIPVCIRLVNRYTGRENHAEIPPVESAAVEPFSYARRATQAVGRMGGDHVPVVIVKPGSSAYSSPEALAEIGYEYDPDLDKWHIGDQAADFVYLGDTDVAYDLPGTLTKVFDYEPWCTLGRPVNAVPLYGADQYVNAGHHSPVANFIQANLVDLKDSFLRAVSDDPTAVVVLTTPNLHAMAELRRGFFKLLDHEVHAPVIIRLTYPALVEDQLLIHAATDAGGLLVDGLGDGLWLDSAANSEAVNRITFGILQAARTRVSKTEYISCPSCGRTLFDLQETTAMIRERTDHLKGVKIGIMGCIVNGPGEMADADYGYVGSGPDQITLYRGQDVVKRAIPTKGAVDELIGLIKTDGKWVTPL